MRRTRIMATIGTALNKPDKIAMAILAGVDVFRQSASHQTLEQRLKVIENIKKAEKIAHRSVEILVDMPGSRPRIGSTEERQLKPGETLVLSENSIPVDGFAAIECAEAGDTILISDGLIQLLVTEKRKGEIRCMVVRAREALRPRRNLLVAGKAAYSPFRSTDVRELEQYARYGIDYIALSFVKNARDVEAFRKIIRSTQLKDVEIVAKIESKEALENLDGIAKAADSIMVARGDLAHVSLARLPQHQLDIVAACRKYGKPCIIATQVMESMADSPIPLRAEIIDAANAVYQGADCVMLGAETARGKYPIETIRLLSDILAEAEKDVAKNPQRRIQPSKSAGL